MHVTSGKVDMHVPDMAGISHMGVLHLQHT